MPIPAASSGFACTAAFDPADPSIMDQVSTSPGGALTRIRSLVLGLKGWRRLALAFGFGVLATGALPPAHAVILLVPAFSGLVWQIEGGPGPRSAFAVGWWFGLGYFAAGLYWVSFALLTFPDRFGWMAPLAVFGLSGLLALFPAGAALSSRLAGLGGAGGILVFAAVWTAFEWLRGWVLTGFPWNLVGSVWTFSDGMIQGAAVAGVHGLGLLTVAAAAMPAVLLAGGKGGGRAVLAAFAALAAVWGAGQWRLAGADGAMVPDVRLRLVQPNIDQKLKWHPDLRAAHVAEQLRMSVRPGKGAPPTHVIWAETAVPYYLSNSPEIRAAIGEATPKGGLTITGALRSGPGGRVWNSLFAIDEGGRVTGTYDKFHLVPFGEYVPFRRFLGFAKVTEGGRDFSPGAGLVTMELKGLPPAGPLICYEVIFPGSVAAPDNRPGWLLNITNDAWYGLTAGPYQHFAAARLRAVEEGLPVVRVANNGISGVVDAYGRVLASLGLGVKGTLDSGLPTDLEGPTLYARFGDWTLLVLVLAVAGCGFLLSGRAPAHANRR